MPTLNSTPLQSDVLKYELNPNISREVVTLLAGRFYPLGAVLGRITATGKHQLSPATGSDGSETAVAVLLYPVDATAGDAPGVVLRRGPSIVSKAGLVYDATVNDATKIATKQAQLVAAGIIPRESA